MSEPVYEYVKGKGWTPTHSPVYKTECGVSVRLEFRTPNEGEIFTWHWVTAQWRQDVEWVNWITTTIMKHLNTWQAGMAIEPRGDYVVVIPV